jgi:hypothetical protein
MRFSDLLSTQVCSSFPNVEEFAVIFFTVKIQKTPFARTFGYDLYRQTIFKLHAILHSARVRFAIVSKPMSCEKHADEQYM